MVRRYVWSLGGGVLRKKKTSNKVHGWGAVRGLFRTSMLTCLSQITPFGSVSIDGRLWLIDTVVNPL